MAFLTDRTLATGVTLQDLIHIVITGDTSQNPAGSSYKATIQQVSDAILDGFTTGSTDYYVTGGTYSGGTLVLDRQNGSVTITGFTGSTQLYEVGSGTNSTQRINVGANASGAFSTVGGGYCNTSSGYYSTVSGGLCNTSNGCYSFVGSGFRNVVFCNYSSIGGGSGNTASNLYSFVGGGQLNTASGIHSVVGGGEQNKATCFCNFVGGGGQNTAFGFRTVIAGGRQNTTSSTYSTISGGWLNKALCTTSTIAGGIRNTASGDNSSILGGILNTAFCNYGTILGGSGNTINHELSAAYGKSLKSVSACTFHVNYLALQNTPEIDSSGSDVLVRDSVTGVVKEKDLTHYNFGLFVQTGDSATVVNTITETTILDGGIGTLSVPTNGFNPGDSFHVKIGGIVSANNGDKITINIKSGSAILGTDNITFTNGVTNRSWEFNADFTIRTIGSPTVASIITNGTFMYHVNSDVYGGGFSTFNNTTFDTTNPNTLDFTVTWGSASAGNSIQSSIAILKKVF